MAPYLGTVATGAAPKGTYPSFYTCVIKLLNGSIGLS